MKNIFAVVRCSLFSIVLISSMNSVSALTPNEKRVQTFLAEVKESDAYKAFQKQRLISKLHGLTFAESIIGVESSYIEKKEKAALKASSQKLLEKTKEELEKIDGLTFDEAFPVYELRRKIICIWRKVRGFALSELVTLNEEEAAMWDKWFEQHISKKVDRLNKVLIWLQDSMRLPDDISQGNIMREVQCMKDNVLLSEIADIEGLCKTFVQDHQDFSVEVLDEPFSLANSIRKAIKKVLKKTGLAVK